MKAKLVIEGPEGTVEVQIDSIKTADVAKRFLYIEETKAGMVLLASKGLLGELTDVHAVTLRREPK